MDVMIFVYALIWLAILAFCIYVLNMILRAIPNIPPIFRTIILSVIGLIAFIVIVNQLGLLGPMPHVIAR